MRELLIVKAGSTLPEIAARRGDFEAWIATRIGLAQGRIRIVAVYADAPLPAADTLAGIVVTGSSAMVSHAEAWSERTAAWLGAAALAGTPLLGICYGHQLLAHALGGRVARNPLGREIGTVEVRLHEAARDDALFAGLPAQLRVQATHLESVLSLPPGARLLASNPDDPHQAFAVGPRAWGVQFHPEFDADIVRGYLAARRDAVRSEGLDPDALLRGASDSPHGAAILRRFGSLLRD